MVGGPEGEEVGCRGDVVAILVDFVAGEVGADVEVGGFDAGGRGDGVRVPWGGDAEERARDRVAETEVVEVLGVFGGEDEEVGLEVGWGEAGGVGYEVVAGEQTGFVRGRC